MEGQQTFQWNLTHKSRDCVDVGFLAKTLKTVRKYKKMLNNHKNL